MRKDQHAGRTKETGLKVDDPSPSTKLYVKEASDKARNQAIGVLGFVALVAGFGAFQNARNYVDQKWNESNMKPLEGKIRAAVVIAESEAKRLSELRTEHERMVSSARAVIRDGDEVLMNVSNYNLNFRNSGSKADSTPTAHVFLSSPTNILGTERLIIRKNPHVLEPLLK